MTGYETLPVQRVVWSVGDGAAGTNTYSLDVRGEFLPAMTIFETDLPYALYRTAGSSGYDEFVVWCFHAEQATSVPIHSIPSIHRHTHVRMFTNWTMVFSYPAIPNNLFSNPSTIPSSQNHQHLFPPQ